MMMLNKFELFVFFKYAAISILVITSLVLIYASLVTNRAEQPPAIVVSSDFQLPTVDTPNNSRGIPKIIHQTWKDADIPELWKPTRQSCMSKNPDYIHLLWTDEMLYNFMFQKYPWFYKTFLRYSFNIQRIDSVRYFILHHYGGFYMDLDMQCNLPMVNILNAMNQTQSVILAATAIDGVTNGFMGAPQRSPFFDHVVQELPVYTHGYFEIFRHTTIIFSTGSQFLSHCMRIYENQSQIYVIPMDDFREVYFTNHLMNGWHSFDTNIVDIFQYHYLCVLSFALTFLCLFILTAVKRYQSQGKLG